MCVCGGGVGGLRWQCPAFTCQARCCCGCGGCYGETCSVLRSACCEAHQGRALSSSRSATFRVAYTACTAGSSWGGGWWFGGLGVGMKTGLRSVHRYPARFEWRHATAAGGTAADAHRGSQWSRRKDRSVEDSPACQAFQRAGTTISPGAGKSCMQRPATQHAVHPGCRATGPPTQ